MARDNYWKAKRRRQAREPALSQSLFPIKEPLSLGPFQLGQGAFPEPFTST